MKKHKGNPVWCNFVLKCKESDRHCTCCCFFDAAKFREMADDDPAPEPVQAPEPWTREKVLAEAKRCVCGERDQSYGGPEDSFRLIAKLWEPYVKEKIVPKNTPVDIEPEDVAIMMGMLKIARLASNPTHMDSWVDLGGYAACGGEIAGKEVQG